MPPPQRPGSWQQLMVGTGPCGRLAWSSGSGTLRALRFRRVTLFPLIAIISETSSAQMQWLFCSYIWTHASCNGYLRHYAIQLWIHCNAWPRLGVAFLQCAL